MAIFPAPAYQKTIDQDEAAAALDRRLFLTSLLSFAAIPQLPVDVPPPSRTVGIFPLPPPFNKQSATFVELYCVPGQQSDAHRHPGFVLGYVIEGELRFQVAGQSERIVKIRRNVLGASGRGAPRSGKREPRSPVRFLAIVIADSGKPIVEPV